MEALEILEVISNGETTKVQFKENIHNELSVAQEMVAFANKKGGKILVGVNDKTWEIKGLTSEDLRRLSTLLANAANDHVKPPIFIETETVDVNGKKVIIVTVPEGIHKPYKDKDGIIFLRNGDNKRKVTSNEELSRLLQSSGNLYAEEMVLQHSSLEDFDWEKFKAFYEEKYKEPCKSEEIPKYLSNLRIGEGHKLNVAGALLFGRNTQRLVPTFFITAIWFWGNEITDTQYRSSENIVGTLDTLYHKGFDFVLSKLQRVQAGQSFNSLGKSEIPEIVITELLVNALIHRDYFIQDSIKLFVFENRIEIISPGKLPNSLTEEQIKKGVRRSRNNILASLAPDLMAYRGAGSGILRALQEYPDIDFINEQENERFIVTIHRHTEMPKDIFSEPAYKLAKAFTVNVLIGSYVGFEGLIRYIKDHSLEEPLEIKFGVNEIVVDKNLFREAATSLLQLGEESTYVGLEKQIIEMLDRVYSRIKDDSQLIIATGIDKGIINLVIEKIDKLKLG